MISETWFAEGRVFDETLRELKHGHGIDMICTNRKGASGRNSGGGTSIAYRKSKMSLKTFPVRRNGFELTVAKGRFIDNKRPTFLVSVYIPPGLRRAKFDSFLDTLRECLNKIKLDERSPLIIMG